jgi:hypothetical protein
LTQKNPVETTDLVRLRELHLDTLPRMGDHWNQHSIVFLRRQSLSRLLYVDHLYRQIVDVPGVICEFGVQWGATLSALVNLRGIYEPYNISREIYGFDTFTGFAAVHDKDGGFSKTGDYAVAPGYEELLDEVLAIHERQAPVAHIRKTYLVKGDVRRTLPEWLEIHPHTVIALAIFDMDMYAPTRAALEAILPRMSRRSILVFDELTSPYFPGEAQAVMEVLELNKLRLHRHPHQPYCAWATFGD